MANSSCGIIGEITPLHTPCDHDLMPNSKIFGGSDSDNCSQFDLPNSYFTDALDCLGDRDTTYYAIVSFNANFLNLETERAFDLPTTNYSTAEEIFEDIKELSELSELSWVGIEIDELKDNTVELLSQLGRKDN